MNKQIIIESCNNCPYCKDHHTDTLQIYLGTSCSHKESKKLHIFLGSWDDREKVHKSCPLDNDELGWLFVKDVQAPHGVPVWCWNPEWVSEDFNPEGIREGFWNDDGYWTTCGWDACQDVFTTIDNQIPVMWASRVQPKER